MTGIKERLGFGRNDRGRESLAIDEFVSVDEVMPVGKDLILQQNKPRTFKFRIGDVPTGAETEIELTMGGGGRDIDLLVRGQVRDEIRWYVAPKEALKEIIKGQRQMGLFEPELFAEIYESVDGVCQRVPGTEGGEAKRYQVRQNGWEITGENYYLIGKRAVRVDGRQRFLKDVFRAVVHPSGESSNNEGVSQYSGRIKRLITETLVVEPELPASIKEIMDGGSDGVVICTEPTDTLAYCEIVKSGITINSDGPVQVEIRGRTSRQGGPVLVLRRTDEARHAYWWSSHSDTLRADEVVEGEPVTVAGTELEREAYQAFIRNPNHPCVVLVSRGNEDEAYFFRTRVVRLNSPRGEELRRVAETELAVPFQPGTTVTVMDRSGRVLARMAIDKDWNLTELSGLEPKENAHLKLSGTGGANKEYPGLARVEAALARRWGKEEQAGREREEELPPEKMFERMLAQVRMDGARTGLTEADLAKMIREGGWGRYGQKQVEEFVGWLCERLDQESRTFITGSRKPEECDQEYMSGSTMELVLTGGDGVGERVELPRQVVSRMQIHMLEEMRTRLVAVAGTMRNFEDDQDREVVVERTINRLY